MPALPLAGDAEAMARALAEAEKSLAGGDMPVGAALVIGGRIVDAARNTIGSTRTLVAHAEMTLLIRHGSVIFAALARDPRAVNLFTTLEPCLMCLSACAHSRVSRVVYACRDAVAGAAKHPAPSAWYRSFWPSVEHQDALEGDSARLLLRYSDNRPGFDDLRRALSEITGRSA